MHAGKYLIVNADDFGLSEGVNKGIIETHERGIVTSASLMVHGAAVENAIEQSRAHPQLALGLHIDLGEWFFQNGSWLPLYERARVDDPSSVKEEIERQFEKFCGLVGRNPT